MIPSPPRELDITLEKNVSERKKNYEHKLKKIELQHKFYAKTKEKLAKHYLLSSI